MYRLVTRAVLLVVSVVLWLSTVLLAAGPAPRAGVSARQGITPIPTVDSPAAPPATVPFQDPAHRMRHIDFLETARAGGIDLLFVGDSITNYWRGLDVWDHYFGPLNAANFGLNGDTTQGVLWRMRNGELDGFKAKLIVLMLGTNNVNRNPNADIAEGDRLIIEEFKKHQPQAKILLLGIFPRGADGANPFRASIKEINQILEKQADNQHVFYMDIGDRFLAPDGTLPAEIMPDALHLSPLGYQLWADAIAETVKKLME